MHTCRDVTRLIASDAYLDAGFWERAKIRLHLAMCRACRDYVEQMRLLGQRARAVLGKPESGKEAVSDRERLENSILESIRRPHEGGDA